MSESRIIQDKNFEIAALYFNDSEDSHYSVAEGYQIQAYEEPGPHCLLPFFEVTNGGVLFSRVPATMVEVVYKTPE